MFSNFSRVSVGPFGLFAAGCVSLLDPSLAPRRFAVAGSRRGLSQDSVSWLQSQVDLLDPASHVLVSGLALGSDGIAHRRALARGVPQIVVLPSGFNNVVPASHRGLLSDIIAAGGCVVSLLSPNRGPSRSSYIDRNQLIVPQFEVRSGTRSTVDFARGYGRFIITRDCAASGNQFIINNDSYHTICR